MVQPLTFSVRRSRLILIFLFVLSLPAVTTRIYASDEVEAFVWLHSLAFDHDVSFQNEYQYFYDSGQVKNPAFHETFLERTTEIGRRVNFTTLGAAVLWAPFYAAGHVAAPLVGAPADGLSRPYIAAAAIGSACYGFLAVLLSAAIATRVAGVGTMAALAVWIGTPLFFYMYVTPLFAHACSAFAVALFLWTWLRVREHWSPRGALLLGLTGALMTLVRSQDAFFIAGPVLDFVRTASISRRAALVKPALAGALAFVAAYAPQLLAYYALNGHPGPSVYESRKMSWSSPHGWQVVFDAQHGLFAWTPLALVAVVGLIGLAAARTNRPSASTPSPRWIAVCALVMFVLQAYIAGAVESWTVAGAFGQRRFVSVTPLLVVGLACWLAAGARRVRAVRWAAVAVIVIGVWWNVGLMAQFGLHTMDRERVDLRANARRTFVELPIQLPSLVWRYLTNRASFYGQ